MKTKLKIMLGLLVGLTLRSSAEGSAVDSARRLIERRLPAAGQQQFVLEQIPATSDGYDVYELGGEDGKVVLRGNNGVSLASALNQYLKYTCNASLSWAGAQLDLPAVLPAPEAMRKVAPLKYRAYLNYCVFSYTVPWWDWKRWEYEIDLMAMNGINIPLNIVGQEAVWLNTFMKLGLTQQQLTDNFLAGPAYYAWAWMANLDKVGGPLPISWIQKRTILGQQMNNRMRELGMEPVLQGFTGRVPGDLREIMPSAKIAESPKAWGGLPPVYQLDPTDPVFEKIAAVFYAEQEKLFGKTRFFAADPFHESHPPVDTPEYLSAVGKVIAKTMDQANPESIWVMQSWSLRDPVLTAADPKKLLVFDLNGMRAMGKTVPFKGYPAAWGILNNYGGRTYLRGPLSGMLNRRTAIYHPNVIGMGMWDEAIELNPVIFEALYENSWNRDAVDVGDWLDRYVERRYGTINPELKAAWRALEKSAYSGGKASSLLAARPCLSVTRSGPNEKITLHYAPEDLLAAWELLVAGGKGLGQNPGYRFDLVLVGRQVLANQSIVLYNEWVDAFLAGDQPRYETAKQAFLSLLDDLDELLSSSEMTLLGKWIEDARSWGDTEAEKNLYEKNARALVSLWEVDHNSSFFDYAWRYIGGLVKGYYKERWVQYFAFLDEKLAAGEAYDDWTNRKRVFGKLQHTATPFHTTQHQWERSWVSSHNSYPAGPVGDTYRISTQLVSKYAPKIKSALEMAEKEGYPVITTVAALNKTQEKERPGMGPAKGLVPETPVVQAAPSLDGNLARNKGVTCSAGRSPELIVDGKKDNARKFWSANQTPASITIDLGAEENFNQINLYPFWDGKRFYQYDVETSTDGLAWKRIVDGRKNEVPASQDGYRHPVTESAQLVKVTIFSNSANPAAHIVEVEVLQDE